MSSKNHTIALDQWRLADIDAGAGAAQKLQTAPLDYPGMVGVAAPGDIYLSLHQAGRIPDPFGDRAEAACAWVEHREWWYRADVEVPSIGADQRAVLEFEGLDTFATIWLNGEPVADTDNMFRLWRFDVTARLRPGLNQLALRFTPPALAVTAIDLPEFPMASSPSAENKRNFMRKAQFGWGWDFAPHLVTAGIWKIASLKIETRAVLKDVRFSTDMIAPNHDSAHISIDASADAFAGDDAGLSVTITLRAPDGGMVAEATLALAQRQARLALKLDRPALWWTPELGPANLYSLGVVLQAGGLAVDRRELRVGVRTIALDTSPDPDEAGTKFFRFVLNGVPIFARGVNWVPPSSLVAAIDEPHYRRLLTLAAGANMNMIRVWGGGIYEHDPFYDLCDEMGLLVWQDFMFACAPYPEHDPAFVENVRAEVGDQVRRLRHHACLALWCGNNESQAIHGFKNSKTGRDDPLLGELFYDTVIPELLARLDPATPYRAGSPFGGQRNNHNSMLEGDIHDWTVWHGLPTIPDDGPVGEYDRSPAGVAYTRYAEDMGRFISEYGIQSAPVMAAFRRALPEDQRALGSPGFLNRIKDRPVDKVNAMLVSIAGLPETLEQYVDFTQINQAEGLKFGIEHFRRRKPHCSGSLIWQFNDCWPGISWSIVDFYGYTKAAYHYVRRAYAPVMASFKDTEGGVELWIVNDTLAPAGGQLLLTLEAFAGTERWTTTVDYLVAPNSSSCVWRSDDTRAYGARHVLSVRSAQEKFPANKHFFVPIKDLIRPTPHAPLVTMSQAGPRKIRIDLTAVDYLYYVHILTDDEHLSVSDNYFDLRAGEARAVVVSHSDEELDSAMLTVRWR
ncbi:MAG: sugar-binding domain-containing protein [Pseudomonadota bacterium]